MSGTKGCWSIIGVEKVDYFSTKQNKQVRGTSYYYTCEDSGIQGVFAGNQFVNCDSEANYSYLPRLGDLVMPVRNRRGFLSDFEHVGSASGK